MNKSNITPAADPHLLRNMGLDVGGTQPQTQQPIARPPFERPRWFPKFGGATGNDLKAVKGSVPDPFLKRDARGGPLAGTPTNDLDYRGVGIEPAGGPVSYGHPGDIATGNVSAGNGYIRPIRNNPDGSPDIEENISDAQSSETLWTLHTARASFPGLRVMAVPNNNRGISLLANVAQWLELPDNAVIASFSSVPGTQDFYWSIQGAAEIPNAANIANGGGVEKYNFSSPRPPIDTWYYVKDMRRISFIAPFAVVIVATCYITAPGS